MQRIQVGACTMVWQTVCVMCVGHVHECTAQGSADRWYRLPICRYTPRTSPVLSLSARRCFSSASSAPRKKGLNAQKMGTGSGAQHSSSRKTHNVSNFRFWLPLTSRMCPCIAPAPEAASLALLVRLVRGRLWAIPASSGTNAAASCLSACRLASTLPRHWFLQLRCHTYGTRNVAVACAAATRTCAAEHTPEVNANIKLRQPAVSQSAQCAVQVVLWALVGHIHAYEASTLEKWHVRTQLRKRLVVQLQSQMALHSACSISWRGLGWWQVIETAGRNGPR
jgi:hypothetical protein